MTREDLESYGYNLDVGTDILVGDGIIESAQVTESINGDGGITLTWKSFNCSVIEAGSQCGEYVMMEPYAPSRNEDGTYTYSPKYSDPSALLGKVLYYKNVMFYDSDSQVDGDGSEYPLYTFDYYGPASEIIDDINTFLSGIVGETGSAFTVSLESSVASRYVSLNVDGDSVKSVLSKIADSCELPLWFNGRTISIGNVSNYHGDSYYNTFIVLGGTKNMAKKTTRGTYAAITRRLTINTEGSRLGGGYPMMEKLLIFDDIYPKMELKIASAEERRCYVLDDEGRKIVDYYQTDDEGNYILDDNDEKIPVYKQYSKWYIRLNQSDGETEYGFNKNIIIENRPLGILFQSGALTGHEFELVAFTEDSATEKEDDDVSDGYTPSAGDYRIAVSAEGSVLLPSTSEQGIIPAKDDVVTLTNVALDDSYITEAQEKLQAAGEEAASYYSAQSPDADSETYYEGTDIVTGDVIGGSGGSSSLTVTSITRDLITGKVSVQYGTFAKKGLVSSMVDKLDAASVNGGSGTKGASGSDDEGVGRTISVDQWKALQMAGGNLGMRTVTERVDTIEPEVTQLVSDMEAVQLQTDKKIEMWFRPAIPYPNVQSPNATATYPASDWTAEEYADHAQDLYYDTRKLVLGSTDCRVWRWEQVAVEGTDSETGETVSTEMWLWNEVTDAQTIAALEAIVDVASDGILSAGAEKSRTLIEWRAAAADYAELSTRVSNHDAWAAYEAAYEALCQMLNNGIEYTDTSTPPLWIDADHILTNTTIDDPDEYRTTWDNYYAAYTALTGEVTSKKCSVFVSVSSEPPQPPYNVGDMWIQTDQDNKVMVCINQREAGTYTTEELLSDWQEMSAQADARTLLIALAEEIYATGIFSTESSVVATFSADGAGSVSGITEKTASLDSALAGCYDAFGSANVTLTLNSTPSEAQVFDLILKPLTYTDSLIGDTIEGGLDILMYNSKGTWELIAKSTSATIDNLGNAIRMLVFGNADTSLTRDELMQAAGIAIKQNFAQIFAQAIGLDGNILAESFVRVYTDGVLSGIQMRADKLSFETEDGTSVTMDPSGINFNSNNYTINASHIVVGSGDTGIVVEDEDDGSVYLNASLIKIGTGLTLQDGALVFNGDTVSIDASKVNISGDINLNSIILVGESDGQTYAYINADYIQLGEDGGLKVENGALSIDLDNFKINPSQVVLSSGDSFFTIASDGSATLDADKINFVGKTVINGKFTVAEDGTVTMTDLIANNASVTGSLVMPADSGSISYSGTITHQGEATYSMPFGLFINSSTVFQSDRADYLYGYTERGAVLRIETGASASSFRGIYCDAEVEVQGVTQLLRTATNQNDDSVNALIVEGVDNKGNETVKGAIRAKGGVLQFGQYLYAPGGTIDLSKGTNLLIRCSYSNAAFTLPTLSELQEQLGLSSGDTTPFVIPVMITAHKDTLAFYLNTPTDVNFIDLEGGDGGTSRGHSAGDVSMVECVYDGSSYYIQIVMWQA